MSFDEFGLIQPLLQAVEDHGFASPTPIQTQAIPPALEGRDIVGSAQTGTGKTVAFLLPAMQRLHGSRPNPRRPQMVVLAPTRELALQISDEARSFARHTPISVCTVYGGASIKEQADELRRGVDLVVATPGRLLDHMRRGNVSYDDLQILVLDEADRMLDMGFLPDMRSIIRQMPAERQTMMFSATMPDEVQGLANEFLRDPVRLDILASRPPAILDQALYPVPVHLKTDLLLGLLEGNSVDSMLVFTRTKANADVVYRKLKEAGTSVDVIHGDFPQKRRLSALHRFKQGDVRVLVATNIASRGLDIEDISHVLNFDMPDHAEDYVHRIGRTARAHAEGEAITLVTPEDERQIAKIEHFLGHPIERRRLEGFNYDVPAPSWAKPSFEALLEKARGDDEEKIDRWRSLARF
ncbi:MAG TPA: DEAD/DEAH box helicase [Anaerolineales bacterium]|jgi:ATP-dependent RNA helicase RhlE